MAEEEIERLKQHIDAKKKQIKEIKIEKDEVMRVKGTEINNLKEKLRVVESTPVGESGDSCNKIHFFRRSAQYYGSFHALWAPK